MNQKELEQITQWIKEATTKPNADENIQLILKLASNSITQDKVENLVKPTNPDTKSFITHFTKKEIAKMSKTFKKEFIANGLAAHVLKRQNSKNAFIFEIRYRRNGYHIHVSGATLEKAKERFIQETMPDQIQKHRCINTSNMQKKRVFMRLFCIIARFWCASIGIAPLAARPARQLLIADFAVKGNESIPYLGKAFCSRKTAPPSIPVEYSYSTKQKSTHKGVLSCLVRSTGIEAVFKTLKAFILKAFSPLLAKNTPIILGFRDREFLSNFKANFCPIFVFFTVDRLINSQK